MNETNSDQTTGLSFESLLAGLADAQKLHKLDAVRRSLAALAPDIIVKPQLVSSVELDAELDALAQYVLEHLQALESTRGELPRDDQQ